MNRMAVVGALACAMVVGCSAQNGAPGAAGATGQKGDTGAVGPSGPQGVQGPQGPQGVQGLQGVTGPSGQQGPQGIQGLTGLQGAKGIVWRGSWSTLDTYFQDDAVEHNGSAYVAIATSSGLAPPSTDWQLLAARGLDGTAGVAGAAGPTGPVGPAGATGAAGLDGQSVATASIGPGHPICTYGGTLIQSASGDRYVCHGAPGSNGTAGTPGAAGTSVSAVSLLPGADPACPAGGTKFTTGSTVTYACNATEAGPCPLGRMLCGGTCRDLTVDPVNCGACGNTCPSAACFGGSCAKTVFATQGTTNGAFGGVAGGNAICQAAATAAGLSGTYKAWLSDGLGASPGKTFTRSSQPYVLVTGALVASNWAALVAVNGSTLLTHSINVDQFGNAIVGNAWTGTNEAGAAWVDPNYSCFGWTNNGSGAYGEVGAVADSSTTWTKYTQYQCSMPNHLYCFEQ